MSGAWVVAEQYRADELPKREREMLRESWGAGIPEFDSFEQYVDNYIDTVSNDPDSVAVIRHGYVDTSSSAGTPQQITFRVRDVLLVKSWCNTNGNPSYVLYGNEDAPFDTLYLVDDYGALNNMRDVTMLICDRKRDMFNRWHG